MNKNDGDYNLESYTRVTKSQLFDSNSNEKLEVLIFFADMGVRWVSKEDKNNADNDDEDFSDGCCVIEASYVASYVKLDELTEDHLLAFASQNVVFNIWPYWREYVSNQTIRLGVPKLTLPFYSPPRDGELKISKKP